MMPSLICSQLYEYETSSYSKYIKFGWVVGAKTTGFGKWSCAIVSLESCVCSSNTSSKTSHLGHWPSCHIWYIGRENRMYFSVVFTACLARNQFARFKRARTIRPCTQCICAVYMWLSNSILYLYRSYSYCIQSLSCFSSYSTDMSCPNWLFF